MRAGPLPKSDIKRIVSEIADALNGIHAHRILHRDLKPENVLIRSASPLELALTDFGIASLAAATQHFTSAARTTKYAAPEALTGVLDVKSDWWSLGMIVLEASSGRHPFEGLNEQVMNHHLATRPIDVRSVYDDELRVLCRGLLLRDPKRRWGADEVARWLAADPTLAVSDDAEGAATAVRPYRFGNTEATSSAELGLALAKHWDAACRDLARGQIARWLEHELHDYNLLRALRDIEDRKGLTNDGRLLQFLIKASPDLPPVWRGSPVSEEAVLAPRVHGGAGVWLIRYTVTQSQWRATGSAASIVMGAWLERLRRKYGASSAVRRSGATCIDNGQRRHSVVSYVKIAVGRAVPRIVVWALDCCRWMASNAR
jgi:hypothetical protein